MNIGVIGTGNSGEVIIRKLRDVGYPVKMAHARGPESLKDLAAQTGAIPVSVEQVVHDVDMLFIVVPQKSIPELPKGFLNTAKKGYCSGTPGSETFPGAKQIKTVHNRLHDTTRPAYPRRYPCHLSAGRRSHPGPRG